MHRHDRDDERGDRYGARVNRRELTHDASVDDAYRQAAGELRERGADVRDVVMERELKREYQEFLQARNRERADSDGRPERDAREIERWAREHDLPYFDDRVHMIERLMVLDAVLDDAAFTWLATEFDKRSYFIRTLGKDLPLKEYPRLTFGEGTAQTVRLFPDKMPIGIQHDGHDHRFLYLVTRPEPMDFRVFLLRHAELLRSLRRSTIRVLVPQPFARGIPRFGHAAREVLATPINYEAQPELLWYCRERQKSPRDRAPSEDQRFRTAALLYRAPRFRALSRAWEHQGDGLICRPGGSPCSDPIGWDTLPYRKAGGCVSCR